MTLTLNDEQQMLRDSARGFFADRTPVASLRRLREQRDGPGHDTALWKDFAEMGYTALLVPQAHGGSALGMVEAGVLMEQIGRHLCATPWLASSVLSVSALREAGSDAQQAHWLPKLASGECIATLAWDEHRKHRPHPLDTVAARTAEGYRLDGAKTLVLDGHVAGLFIVAARDGVDGHAALFLVPAAVRGVTVERTVMLDAHNAARVRFDGVMLDAGARLERGSEAALQRVLDIGRAAVAAELLGVADEVFERTLAYLKERRQFGRLIGEFQALQHRAATLFVDLEMSRAALRKAVHALDANGKSGTAVAVAKAKCADTATRAVQEAVQMHGGMGMTDEFDIGLFMKRARTLVELFGDAGFHQERLARDAGY